MCRRCWFLPTGGSRRAFHFSNFLTARPVLKWHSCRVKHGVKCHVPNNDQQILFRSNGIDIFHKSKLPKSLTLWVLCKNRRNQLENFAGPTPNRCCSEPRKYKCHTLSIDLAGIRHKKSWERLGPATSSPFDLFSDISFLPQAHQSRMRHRGTQLA